MESHDEIIENAIQKRKEKETKEQNKLRIKQIEMEKKELARHPKSEFHYGARDTGIQKSIDVSMDMSKSLVRETNLASNYADLSAGKGLKLGKSATKKPSLDLLREEVRQFSNPSGDNASETKQRSLLGTRANLSAQSSYASKQTEPIAITVEEFVSATLNKESQLETFDVRGSLLLSIIDPNYASVRLCLSEFINDKNLQLKTHPNINKESFSNGHVLEMRDSSKPFPCNQNLGLLKWKYSSVSRNEEMYLPISISLWTTQMDNGNVEISVEFECKNASFFPIKDLMFRFPCPENFQVSAIDGEYSYDQSYGTLDWSVPVVNSKSPSGCLTFSITGTEIHVVFPVQIFFHMEKSIFNFDLEKVASIRGEEEASVDSVEKRVSCQAENYIIQF